MNPAQPSRTIAGWRLGLRVWLERSGQSILGKGRAELLAAIDRTHSISAAAREIGMSYRHAWVLVQEVNEAAGVPLVEAAVGGQRGGGARLTPTGREAIEFFHTLQAEMTAAAASILRRTLDVPAGDGCVHIVSAVSLQEAVGQLLSEYALANPATRVRAVYGASNELADHLLAGMSADLFLSAHYDELARIEAAGLSTPGTSRKLATNGLVALAASDRLAEVRKPSDLVSAEIRRLALADPACPLGKASRAFLERAGIYDQLLPRVVHVDNSRAVLAALHAGHADLGLAFANEAAASGPLDVLFRVPTKSASSEYHGVVLSSGRQAEDAAALLDFIAGPAGRSCFRRCGFWPAQDRRAATSATSRSRSSRSKP